jgi:hypothetical protein
VCLSRVQGYTGTDGGPCVACGPGKKCAVCVRACGCACVLLVLSCVPVCQREVSCTLTLITPTPLTQTPPRTSQTHACINRAFLTSSHRRGSTFLPLCLPRAGGQAHTRRRQGVPRACSLQLRLQVPPAALNVRHHTSLQQQRAGTSLRKCFGMLAATDVWDS